MQIRTLGTILLTALVALAATSAVAQEAAKKEKKMTSTESADPAIKSIDDFIASQKIDKSKDGWKTRVPKPPMATFDAETDYFWHLETNKGMITIKLMPKVAPMHVTSTIYLSRVGFYDDVIFHRVINGFMAQGGDPLGKGFGGPGYKYEGEFDPKVKHDKPGILSMANAGPGTDGSQFFITFVPTPHLNGKHTIFGHVTEGMDSVRALEKVGSRSGKTSEKVFIKKATISTKPMAKDGQGE